MTDQRGGAFGRWRGWFVLAWMMPALAHAAPPDGLCTIAAAPRVESAFAAQLQTLTRGRAADPASALWRLRALLPARVSVRRSEGIALGLGEVLGTSGNGSERSSVARSAGYAVRVDWDLRALFAPPPPVRNGATRDAGIEARIRAERLGTRWIDLLARHRALVTQAAELAAEEPACAALRAEAAAIAALLRTLAGATPSPPQRGAPHARLPGAAPPPRRAHPS
ncbi:MAG: hypothetical protein H6747_16200 [Deltaproteobacteria bacterium]|nr:hypothetical protein [Deltaproteobacteria bacterium]